MKFIVTCTITIPKYGLGTSRLFGTTRGKIKLPVDVDTEQIAEEKAKEALLANGVRAGEIHNIVVTKVDLSAVSVSNHDPAVHDTLP